MYLHVAVNDTLQSPPAWLHAQFVPDLFGDYNLTLLSNHVRHSITSSIEYDLIIKV